MTNSRNLKKNIAVSLHVMEPKIDLLELKKQSKVLGHIGKGQGDKMRSRKIVLSGMIAALYFVMVLIIAPVSFGPLQFRLACLLYGLVLFTPSFAPGLALGVLLSNLTSPFGMLDILIMPGVTLAACLLGWKFRRHPIPSLVILATVISAGVAAFPLGLGAGLPFVPTFLGVWITQLVIIVGGWLLVWRPLRLTLKHHLEGL